MGEILKLIPFEEEDKIKEYLELIEEEYDLAVQTKRGKTIKEITSVLETGCLIETYTYYKRTLLGKREVATYRIYNNMINKRVTFSNLRFV